MKTNALFTLLVTAAVALVMGCQTTPGGERKLSSWQSKIAGSYTGAIFNGDDEFPAKTTFKNDAGKLSGTYELDNAGLAITGTLSEFTVIGDRKLKCRWTDYANSEGNLNLTFSADMSSFKGHWDRDYGDDGGAWNGKK